MFAVDNNRGFTLIEVFVAIIILSVGLLAMAGLTAGITRGNSFSTRMTTATSLAKEKMEEIRGLGYSGAAGADTTTTEDYGSIPQAPSYRRDTFTDVANPAAGMKTITVTVYWHSDVYSVSLTTILSQ